MSGLLFIATDTPSAKRTHTQSNKTPRAIHTTPPNPRTISNSERNPFERWLKSSARDTSEGLRLVGAAIPKTLKKTREWVALSDYARLEVHREIRDLGALLADGKSHHDTLPESFFSETEKELVRLDKKAKRFTNNPEARESFRKAAFDLWFSLVGEFRPGDSSMIADRRRASLVRIVAIIGGDESNRTELFRLLEEWLQSLGAPFGKITRRSFDHAWNNEPEERNQIVRLIADYREEGTL